MGLFVHEPISSTERKPNNYSTIDAMIARMWEHFFVASTRNYSACMPQPLPPNTPSTPLRILRPKAGFKQGPFYIHFENLDQGNEIVEIADGEVEALAQIIYNAYLEWKKQSPTSGSPASDK